MRSLNTAITSISALCAAAMALVQFGIPHNATAAEIATSAATPEPPLKPAVKPAVGPSDPDDPHGNDANLYTRAGSIGSQAVWIRVRHVDPDKARAAIDAVLAELGRVHRKFDAASKTSEIASINHIADREQVRVSTETRSVLELALKYCRMSAGGFDMTMASFDYLWNFERKPFVPPLPDEVAARLAMTGCDKLVLKPDRGVRISQPGVRISVADMLAGYSLQKAGNVLAKAGIDAFIVKLGTHRYVMGRNSTRYWYTPIAHPLAPDKEIAQVYVGSHGIATRSVADRAVMRRGKRFHDVLDPRTGRPASGVLQATVIATDPILADALSHALLALGPKAGLAMIGKITQDVEAFIVDTKGTVHASAGMRNIAPKLPARIVVDPGR